MVNADIGGIDMAETRDDASQPITRVPAIILGYDGGRGIVLVKHRSSPSLRATFESYLRNPKSGKLWFAFFKWSSIEPGDRAEIEARFQLERKLPREKGQKARGLGRVLSGMLVECTLFKNPTWEATQLSLDLEGRPFVIPENCQKKPIQSSPTPDSPNRFTKRLKGIPSSGKTNLDHPWRG